MSVTSYNKCASQVWGIDSGTNPVCARDGTLGTLVSTQFCCKPETALPKSIKRKKKMEIVDFERFDVTYSGVLFCLKHLVRLFQ